MSGDIEKISEILEDNDYINHQDGIGKTPLNYAMGRPCNVAEFLIEKGANLSIQDNPGDTALPVAVSRKNEAMVRLLIEKGADLEMKNRAYKTPLADAVIKGYENITRLLIDAGADVNIRIGRYETSDTLLHKAVSPVGSKRDVKLLLDNGADVHARLYVFGYTPMYSAEDYAYHLPSLLPIRRSEFVDILKQYGASSMMYKWVRPIHVVLDILRAW